MRFQCVLIVALLLFAIPVVVDGSDGSPSVISNDEGLPISYDIVPDPSGSTKVAKTVPSVSPYKENYKPLVIPDTVIIEGEQYEVKIIGESSFSGWNINSITIPDSVTKIEKDAFRGCYKVTEIHLNGRLTGEKHSESDTEKDIGENAFCLGDEKYCSY